jgi:DNA end-binding protein Ku
MPARSIDSATIAFGLVSIPVKIYSTSEPSHEVHFHLLHAGCGERVHQQYVCPRHGVVARDQLAKGYELKKGTFVEFSTAELKALDAVASEEIAMTEFVPAAEVDMLLVDRSYYLGPGKGGERAYRLFRDALEHAALIGIGTFAARGKQYVVALRPYEDGLAMHQLRYPDEIKAWSEVPVPKLPKPAPAELALAGKIIAGLTKQTFDPSPYKDEVKARVKALIAKKAKGGELVAPEPVTRAELPDLMAALKASLGATSSRGARAQRRARGSEHSSRRATGPARTAARAAAAARRARRA